MHDIQRKLLHRCSQCMHQLLKGLISLQIFHAFDFHFSVADIQSWWQVPSIAHFCSLFKTAFDLSDFDIEVGQNVYRLVQLFQKMFVCVNVNCSEFSQVAVQL